MNDIYFLGDAQYAFLIGRQSSAPLCGVSCHIIIDYATDDIDEEKLRKAWSVLAERHIVLRSRIKSDGSVYLCKEHDPQDFFYTCKVGSEHEAEACVSRLHNRLMDLENGECFALHFIRLANSVKLIFEADCAAFDITSMQIFIRDLAALYNGAESLLPEIPMGFHPYSQAFHPDVPRSLKRADKAYWEERISGFGLPPFEGIAITHDTKTPTVYGNHNGRLEAEKVRRLEKISDVSEIPLKDILLTLFCHATARITENEHFLLNIPLLDRSTESAELRDTAADYTSIIMFDAEDCASESLILLCKRYSHDMSEAVSHRHFSGIKVQQIYSEQGGKNVINGNVTFSSHIHVNLCDDTIKRAFGSLSAIYTETPNVVMDSEFFMCGNDIIINLSTPKGSLPDGIENAILSEIVSAADELINEAEQGGII